MNFETGPAPHSVSTNRVAAVMFKVVLALAPVTIAQVIFFGWGLLLQMTVAVAFALGSEALALRLRRLPARPYVFDGSAIVTALLIAFAVPPLAPWWLAATGASFAILLAKHAYGGLGYNTFNPAMVGYAVLLVSFPVQMTLWPPADVGAPSFIETLNAVMTVTPAAQYDSITGATPLAELRSGLNTAQTMQEIRARATFGSFGGVGWEWMALASFSGGVFLLVTRTIRWHLPVSMLGAFALLAILMNGVDPGRYPTLMFHLTTGSVVFGAFFIVTDPVTSPSSNRGRLIYGAAVGALTYVIRTWAAYPDGLAFAILLMNALAPTIDRYTVPRIYGHER